MEATKRECMCYILGLPQAVLTYVATIIGSTSMDDLKSFRATCTAFCVAADDDNVYGKMSLATVPLSYNYTKYASHPLLKRCYFTKNVEFMYRLGMQYFFQFPRKHKDGFVILSDAVGLGHNLAKYVFSVVVLDQHKKFMGDEKMSQAMRLMRELRETRSLKRFYREVRDFARILRVKLRKKFSVEGKVALCKDHHFKSDHFEDGDEYEIGMCERCRWDVEIEAFCQMVYTDDETNPEIATFLRRYIHIYLEHNN